MGTLLSESRTDDFVRPCREALGDRLRSVTYFVPDDYEQLYLREDLAQDADLMSFIGYEWYDYRSTEDAYRDSELGAHRYTVRAFDNGYLIRVASERAGAFVTTDGQSLERFQEVAASLSESLSED